MADLSRVNEKIATLSAKVDELVARASQSHDGDNQAEVDAVESQLDQILARIP